MNFLSSVLLSDYLREKLEIISSISVITFLVCLVAIIIFTHSLFVKQKNIYLGKVERILVNFPTLSLGDEFSGLSSGDNNFYPLIVCETEKYLLGKS
ncbi:hypothetical protein [Okeania sp. SIO1I7]|uniref:hypothetical protein n=1 Tax=Okeania sp. SIO1I7 TaxID=2607772 RepID=UPI0013F85B09|nr:hypothetical protein [Okeania sp. SIO1I7]NET26492.1 hypothetical protein [Okeania sp. SIO1I7]